MRRRDIVTVFSLLAALCGGAVSHAETTPVWQVAAERSAPQAVAVPLHGNGLPDRWIHATTASHTSEMATSAVSSNGMQLFWQEETEVGTYADGTPWIKGPITIIGKLPAGRADQRFRDKDGALVTDRVIHGMMLNPGHRDYVGGDPAKNRTGAGTQGFDSYDMSRETDRYQAALNLDPGLPGAAPLTVTEGTLVVAKSRLAAAFERPRDVVQRYGIFTVVREPPRDGSLRPPQSVARKTSDFHADDIDVRRLPNWAPPQQKHMPSYTEALAAVERVRYIHTTNNLEARNVYAPNYGRDIARELEDAFLFLGLFRPLYQKEQVAYRLVALGLDIYGRIEEGGRFEGLGGGQAWMDAPLAFAAAMLQSEEIAAVVKARRTGFARQVFTVEERDVYKRIPNPDRQGRRHDPYGHHHIGMAEWGEQHTNQGSRDASNWGASYRWVAASVVPSLYLVRALTGDARYLAGEDVARYIDRYWLNERRNKPGSVNGFSRGAHALMRAAWVPFDPEGAPQVGTAYSATQGDALYLRFDRPIREGRSGAAPNDPAHWTVRVNGTPRAIDSVARSGIGVRLSLSQPVQAEDRLTVSHDPGSQPLLGYDDSPVAAFAEQAVDNRVVTQIESLFDDPQFLRFAGQRLQSRGAKAQEFIRDPRGGGALDLVARNLTPGTRYRFEMRFTEAAPGTTLSLEVNDRPLRKGEAWEIGPASEDAPQYIRTELVTGPKETEIRLRIRDLQGRSAFAADRIILTQN